MKPDDQHPDYTEYLSVWKKCRDAAAGQRAIKVGRFSYLKPLAGQTTQLSREAITAGVVASEYDTYLDRANYFNATGRTVDAMVGMVFRMPMKKEFPDAVLPWLDDVTLSDETLTDLAQSLLSETIITNRVAIMVEHPMATDEPQTLAEKEASGSRPYLVIYKTESIHNWEYKRIGNHYKLFNVWLSETYQTDEGETLPQIRQLTLRAGFYQQIIWKKPKGGSEFIEEPTITPVKNGLPILDIPFYPITSGKPTLEVGVPMIESLADINIAHYTNSADYENGVHMSGLPTPWIAGADSVDAEGNAVPIYLGSTTILTLPEGATAGFLQCGTEGFASLEKAMASKEQQMAALGARMLSPEKKQAEAAQTHEIKRGGENAVLSSVCGTVERQIMAALRFAAEWEGITGEIVIELNRDFFSPNFTGADLLAWVKAWQSGAISKQYMFDAIKYGEYFKDDATFEEMQAQIEEEGPPLSIMADETTGNGNQ